MRVNALIFLGFAIVAAQAVAPAGQAAPSQLYGKSVVVTWTEERDQRVNGSPEIRNVARNGQFSVYLSTAGKPFSRMSYSFSGRRGGLKSGKRDAVAGEGSRRSVTFSGNTLNVAAPMQGGARNVMVTFESGFQSCSARVLTGKEAGSGSIRARSMVSGNAIEILSVKTGAASCRIQDGNVFGSE
ncbi:MAG: hypothetical protein HY242_14255 [Afipia sp.]|nr:hypothetical protein [Afipia sp.]